MSKKKTNLEENLAYNEKLLKKKKDTFKYEDIMRSDFPNIENLNFYIEKVEFYYDSPRYV